MTNDIVAQLRSSDFCSCEIIYRAANRIEALQRALLPFAKAADALDEEAWDNLHIEGSNADITGEHCRAARAALEGKDG